MTGARVVPRPAGAYYRWDCQGERARAMADLQDGRGGLQWPSIHGDPVKAAEAIVAANPRPERARVVFTIFNAGMFHGPGKIQPVVFLPPFCAVLASHGVASHFVSTVEGLAVRTGPRSVVVHIYREVGCDLVTPEIIDAQKDSLIFNAPETGRVIADKMATNRLLARHGIPVPALAEGHESRIFSNSVSDSGARIQLLRAGAPLDPERYNTEFIDTRVRVEGKSYLTTIRLLCVDRHILHAYVRASEVSPEGRLSVHAIDTPLDPALIEHLQATLVVPRMQELADIARRLADVLGPGFYAHDLLVRRGTGEIYVCESGFKFHDWSYGNRIKPIADALPSHRIMLTPEHASRSAELFLQACRERGLRP